MCECVRSVCVCFLSNVVQLTCRAVFLFLLSVRESHHPPFRHTHTQGRGHGTTDTKWHRERFVCEAAAAAAQTQYLAATRCLPRRGINMLHKYKHKSINNFDEQQRRGTSDQGRLYPAGTQQPSLAEIDNLWQLLLLLPVGQNCALPTFRRVPKMTNQAKSVCECCLIKFECAPSKTTHTHSAGVIIKAHSECIVCVSSTI